MRWKRKLGSQLSPEIDAILLLSLLLLWLLLLYYCAYADHITNIYVTAAVVAVITFTLLQRLSITNSLRNKLGIVVAIGLTEADCVEVDGSVCLIATTSNSTHHHHHHHHKNFLEWPKQQCHHDDHSEATVKHCIIQVCEVIKAVFKILLHTVFTKNFYINLDHKLYKRRI